jgi:hypothetical protein
MLYYPPHDDELSLRDIIIEQARQFKRAILDEAPYRGYSPK